MKVYRHGMRLLAQFRLNGVLSMDTERKASPRITGGLADQVSAENARGQDGGQS